MPYKVLSKSDEAPVEQIEFVKKKYSSAIQEIGRGKLIHKNLIMNAVYMNEMIISIVMMHK